MTEQELIDIINGIIDADVQADCWPLYSKDIASRAIARCAEGVFTTEDITDLVGQILSIRVELWKWPPGTRPRLRAWGESVARLAPNPSVMEILEAGRQAGEPIAVTRPRTACIPPAYRGGAGD